MSYLIFNFCEPYFDLKWETWQDCCEAKLNDVKRGLDHVSNKWLNSEHWEINVKSK